MLTLLLMRLALCAVLCKMMFIWQRLLKPLLLEHLFLCLLLQQTLLIVCFLFQLLLLLVLLGLLLLLLGFLGSCFGSFLLLLSQQLLNGCQLLLLGCACWGQWLNSKQATLLIQI